MGKNTDKEIPIAENKFKLADFSKDVLVYSFGSGLLLVFAFIQSFIIPKYLSVESYGYWQTFILYSSYVGLLHLGFSDGLLVKFAGKDIKQIGGELTVAFRFILIEQLIVLVPLALLLHFVFSTSLYDILLLLLVYSLVINIFTFFTYVAQSLRKFKPLTIIKTARGAIFLVIIVAFFLNGLLNYQLVIACLILSYLICIIPFIYWFRSYIWRSPCKFSQLWQYGKDNIRIGLYILLGNFIVILFITIDRLMINLFFTIEDFAFYAFSLAIVMIAFTFIKAVSEVFFPHISALESGGRKAIYHIGKNTIILSAGLALLVYFPLAQLIEIFLPQYMASLIIVKILVGTIGFSSIIQVLHVNYYKLFGIQRQYFLWGIIALTVAIVLNLIVIKVWGTLSSVACATLLSFVIWYMLNEISLKTHLDINKSDMGKGLLLFICYLGAFWISMLAGFLWWQFVIYLVLFAGITGLLLRAETMMIVTTTVNYIKKALL